MLTDVKWTRTVPHEVGPMSAPYTRPSGGHHTLELVTYLSQLSGGPNESRMGERLICAWELARH